MRAVTKKTLAAMSTDELVARFIAVALAQAMRGSTTRSRG